MRDNREKKQKRIRIADGGGHGEAEKKIETWTHRRRLGMHQKNRAITWTRSGKKKKQAG
jgi:hypothetical protein